MDNLIALVSLSILMQIFVIIAICMFLFSLKTVKKINKQTDRNIKKNKLKLIKNEKD